MRTKAAVVREPAKPLIFRRYRLEEINQGYADLAQGRNIRGVIIRQPDAL
jgi:Zn-dependent alcohol dehydrogenase